jgi:transcriptional regulator with XRE-family HTH domain
MVLPFCSPQSRSCQAVAGDYLATRVQHVSVSTRKDWASSTLGERVLFVCELREVSLNKLGEMCGIESGPMSRLSRHKGQVAGSLTTVKKLADGARVSLEWLAYGRGWPEEESFLAEGADLTDTYKNRQRVLMAAPILGGYEDSDLRALRALPGFRNDEDPSTDEWLGMLNRIRANRIFPVPTSERGTPIKDAPPPFGRKKPR